MIDGQFLALSQPARLEAPIEPSMMIGRDMGFTVLNYIQPSLWMLLSLILSATLASAQTSTPNRDQVTMRGTVQAVDATARTVTIKGDTGNVVTLDVPQSVVRLNEVKVGDVVTAVYYDQVTVTQHAAGAPDADRLEPPVPSSTPGALPGGTVAQRRITTVTITGWDPATRVVTFTGPGGAAYSRRLVADTDAALMTGLKVGDRVDITRTEAVRVAVERAGQTAAPDTLRNRLTLSVLFGWDNQFSGKMIQAATGATTGGAPINLEETTYDEVYGKIGIFKIGAGYRTTPRTEAVVNFIWSSSEASEDATPVGTVGDRVGPAERALHRIPGTGAWRPASGGSSRAPASHPSSATWSASTGIRTSVGPSSTCPPMSRQDSPPRMASSSRSRGRSAWGRPAASSSASVPSK